MGNLSSTLADCGNPLELARALFEESGEALFVYDPKDLRICDANPTALQFTQRSRAALQDQRVDELFRNNDTEAVSDLIAACRSASSFRSDQEYSLCCENRPPLPVYARVGRIDLPNPLGLLIVHEARQGGRTGETETTTRSSSETADSLGRRENLLELVTNSVPACIAFVNVQERYEFVNDQYCQLVGKPRGEIIGKLMCDVVPPVTYASIRSRIGRVVAGERLRFETPFQSDFGKSIWLEGQYVPQLSEDGRVEGFCVLLVDITERKRAQEELLVRNRAIDSATNGIVITDARQPDHPIVYCNPAFTAMTGYSADEVIGRNCRFLQRNDHDQAGRKTLREAIAAGRSCEAVVRNYRKDGTQFWNEVRVSPIHNMQKELTHFVAVQHDITQQRRRQAFLESDVRVLQLLARRAELKDIMAALVISVEQQSDGLIGSVLLHDEPAGCLRHVTAPHLPAEYNKLVSGLRVGPHAGVCGTAVFRNELVVVRDTSTDPLCSDYRDLFARFQLRACWSQPIRSSDGRVLGTFAMYYNEPREPTAAELQLIQRAAQLASIAIERKHTDEALLQSEQRYRTLVENAPEAIVVLDVDTQCFVDCNQHAVELFQLDREMLLQRGPVELSPRAQPSGMLSSQAAKTAVQKALDGDTPVFEWVHCDAAGHEIPCEVRLVRLPFANRRLVRGSITDITERKRVEEKLRASEEQISNQYLELEHVYRTAPVGLCLMDANLRFVRINERLAAINGYPVAAHLGKHLREILPDLADDIEPIYQRVIQTGEPALDFEVSRSDPDGVIPDQFFIVSYHPLQNDHRQLQGVGTVVQDITARKLAEQRLRRQEQELTHVARLSTMGEMVAAIAHELNQPLFSIANYAYACLSVLTQNESTPSPDVVRWVEQINSQSIRASEIMKRLSDFVRHDTPRRETVEINTLICDAIDLVSLEAQLRKVDIKCELGDFDGRVSVDGVQIQQVVVNLLRNAFDALQENDEADRHVTVRTMANGEQIEVQVADNGPGYSEDTAAKMFATFFTTKEKGMGMGLAISRSIIKSHGGKLWADRNSTHGATFAFRLKSDHAESLHEQNAESLHRR